MWATWKLLWLCLCLHACCVLAKKSDEEIKREYVAKFQRAFNQTSDWKPSPDVGAATPPKPFLCDTTKPSWYTPATNVRELTPWDISIIGAMGDSVTCGFGADAKTIIGDLIEYKWLSWSIGGSKDITQVSTLPNIIKAYNPDVKGFSERLFFPGLNVANSGAKSPGMIGQAQTLVEKMKKYDSADNPLDDQWKIVTLWIGGNDLCDTCSGEAEDNAKKYAANVAESLDYLSAHLKRAYVNVVDMIDITQLMDLKGINCDIIHNLFCSCATDESTRDLVRRTAEQYNVELQRMLESHNYYNREDYTVALQPFFSDTLVPRKENGDGDRQYFAPDCFHFSTKGHGIGALYLWNNMLEKQGEKTDYIDWDNILDYECITSDNRYFAINSKSELQNAGHGHQGSSTDVVPIVVGSAMAVLVIAVAVIVVAVAIVYRRKKSSQQSREKLPLISIKL